MGGFLDQPEWDDRYDPVDDGFAYPFAAEAQAIKCPGCGSAHYEKHKEVCVVCDRIIARGFELHFQVEFDTWATRTKEGRFEVFAAAYERTKGG